MRSKRTAPVDTKGCHMCCDPNTDVKTQRFQTLISLILSSQTKDEFTYSAMGRLKQYGLNIESVINMEKETIQKLIYPVGFYKKKSIFIKNVAQILKNKYNSDIPNNVDELIKLPGVGPKMAYITMNTAWKKVCGIGVDTHVHRICKRIGWVPSNSSSPEQTRKILESWLPYQHWGNINQTLVGFGQEICTPTKPKCGLCELKQICPYFNTVAKK
ncbi:hypothetical protein HZS_4551 [Henneguya salminicola]|nr:hypothetical protein HZS_4551 [Henneguya salminicola]